MIAQMPRFVKAIAMILQIKKATDRNDPSTCKSDCTDTAICISNHDDLADCKSDCNDTAVHTNDCDDPATCKSNMPQSAKAITMISQIAKTIAMIP